MRERLPGFGDKHQGWMAGRQGPLEPAEMIQHHRQGRCVSQVHQVLRLKYLECAVSDTVLPPVQAGAGLSILPVKLEKLADFLDLHRYAEFTDRTAIGTAGG